MKYLIIILALLAVGCAEDKYEEFYKAVKRTEKGSDDGEEKTSAGKETEKILDGSAMKGLKTAFSKAKSKDAVKETLSAIFSELPEESKGYLKQALKDLAGGM